MEDTPKPLENEISTGEHFTEETVRQLLERYIDINSKLRASSPMSPENGFLMGQQLQLRENLSLIGQDEPITNIDRALVFETADSTDIPLPSSITEPSHQIIAELLSNYRRIYALSLMPEITNYNPSFLTTLFRPRRAKDSRQFNLHSIKLIQGKVEELKTFLATLGLRLQLDSIHTSTESLVKHDPERFRQQVREATFSNNDANSKERLNNLRKITAELGESDKINDSSED